MEIERPDKGCIRFNKKEEDALAIEMTIQPDLKGFDISIRSDFEMSADDIVVAIECFLYQNILDSFEPDHKNIQ